MLFSVLLLCYFVGIRDYALQVGGLNEIVINTSFTTRTEIEIEKPSQGN